MRRDDPTFDAIMLPDLMKLGMFDDCEWEGDQPTYLTAQCAIDGAQAYFDAMDEVENPFKRP